MSLDLVATGNIDHSSPHPALFYATASIFLQPWTFILLSTSPSPDLFTDYVLWSSSSSVAMWRPLECLHWWQIYFRRWYGSQCKIPNHLSGVKVHANAITSSQGFRLSSLSSTGESVRLRDLDPAGALTTLSMPLGPLGRDGASISHSVTLNVFQISTLLLLLLLLLLLFTQFVNILTKSNTQDSMMLSYNKLTLSTMCHNFFLSL